MWDSLLAVRGGSLPDHGTSFLALPLMTAVRDVPSGSLADVKIKRSSRILSSQTALSVAVRSRFPDGSNSLKVATPVQSGFTVYVPEAVDSVTVPFKLAVTVPVRFPAASSVTRPIATLGPMSTTVPLSETPYFPAARANEHAGSPATAWVAAVLTTKVAAKTNTTVVRTLWRCM